MKNQNQNKPDGKNKRINWQTVLCVAVLAFALLTVLVSVLDYTRSVREKNDLLGKIKAIQAQEKEADDHNTVLGSLGSHLKKDKNKATSESSNISKIPNRLKTIKSRDEQIDELTAQLAALTEKAEELRAQLPPGTVVETE